MRNLGYLFMKKCDNCGHMEERVFTDSWTGIDVCLSCLYEVVGNVNMSPASEKDNLHALLIERFPYSDLKVGEDV